MLGGQEIKLKSTFARILQTLEVFITENEVIVNVFIESRHVHLFLCKTSFCFAGSELVVL